MAMPAGGEQQATAEQKSCEIPATRDCCQTAASCAVTFGLGAGVSSNASPENHHRALPL